MVVGGGPVGLLIGLVAARRGAQVVLVELDAAATGAGRRVGYLGARPSGGRHRRSRTGSHRTGPARTWRSRCPVRSGGLDTAVSVLAVVAGSVQVGIHAERRSVDLHRFFWRELELLGARLYQQEDLPRRSQLVASGAGPGAAADQRRWCRWPGGRGVRPAVRRRGDEGAGRLPGRGWTMSASVSSVYRG